MFYANIFRMSLLEGFMLFAAAFFAGATNAIAGGGTLITFPVLIWIGLDAKTANATSTVALWPGLLGGLWGYRKEMENSRVYLIRLGISSIIGGGVGAGLLIATPTETFERLVPFLILFATVLFMLQEPISSRLRSSDNTPAPPRAAWWTGAILFQFASSVYGGYFGAGNGILMLAALGLLGFTDIHRANGIKAFLGICINFVAVLAFAATDLVRWPVAILMAVAAIAGGYGGARVAQKLGRAFVRRIIILIGLTIGIIMLFRVNA
jgi:uncharacterized protein